MTNEQNANSINTELLDTFLEWEQKSNYIDIARENSLSRPYVCSISNYYFNSEKRIMIVGQETKDFPSFEDKWLEPDIQKWGVEYLEKQLWNIGDQKYNRSAFWKLFRYIESNTGYCPCWNNVDKAHRIIDGKTKPLTVELEKALNTTKLSGEFTILQKEIAIAKTNAVLFITGPDYYQSMAASMNVDENELKLLKPTVSCLCSNISQVSKIGVPVLWTYHPTFLNRNETNKQLFSKATNIICEWLSNNQP